MDLLDASKENLRSGEPETQWNQISDSIRTYVKTIHGSEKQPLNKPWQNEECCIANYEKKTRRMTTLQSVVMRAGVQRYKQHKNWQCRLPGGNKLAAVLNNTTRFQCYNSQGKYLQYPRHYIRQQNGSD